MNKENEFKRITEKMLQTYIDKNHDYGDSFGKSFTDHGLTAGVIRISDKYNRLASLSKKADQKVKDESIEDTLLDMANYCIMTLIELQAEEIPKRKEIENGKIY